MKYNVKYTITETGDPDNSISAELISCDRESLLKQPMVGDLIRSLDEAKALNERGAEDEDIKDTISNIMEILD